MTKATLVATLHTPPSGDGEELVGLPAAVEWLEVRADLAGEVDPGWLRQRFRGRLLYTLRSNGEADGERRQRLIEAARHYDLITLDAERDLHSDLAGLADLARQIPPSQRLLYWQGPTAETAQLRACFERLTATPARFYQLVSTAAQPGEEVRLLAFLKSLRRSDTIAFAQGSTGFWSRLVAPQFGSPFIFSRLGGGRELNGEPTPAQLVEDYGLPAMRPVTELYGIVGHPVFHSLSPRMHNAAYRAGGHSAFFVPFQAESFSPFWRELVADGMQQSLGLSVQGLTVASPHKESALSEAGARSPMVERIGASNIFIRQAGRWLADTTDPEGVLLALRARGISPKRARAAVIGCGGAGRAVAAALDQAGAVVTLVNRGMERGRHAVALLGLPFVPLAEFNAEGFHIVVNATPVGRNDGQLPFDPRGMGREAVVIDLVYGASPTPLMTRARKLGCVTIDGREVLLIQVRRQFHLMTGREMPVNLAREVLGWEAETESSGNEQA